jgi:diaminopimelate decarboxylase
MDFFEYRKGHLCCEKVPIAEIVRTTGTPVYVYSSSTLERHFHVFDDAFRGISHITCYSCKANSNIAILRLMGRLGGGLDIVSGGELYRAFAAGIPAEKIVFSGAGKTEGEIREAIRAGILMINVESEGELDLIVATARRMKKRVPVSIRVNPEVDPKTHPYITTGMKKNKFGVLWAEAFRLYLRVRDERYLEAAGISSHIGSQILELGPFLDSVRSVKGMILALRGEGVSLRYMDIGGGLGITYKDELPPHPEDYGKVIEGELRDLNVTLILEPGRVLVGNAGVLVTKLLFVKQTSEKTFYIVDGAMNDLVRPAFYNAYHRILPVAPRTDDRVKVDLVGPVCESGDFFARDREVGRAAPGDLLAIMGAGAYGFSMSSNYNSRRRVPEVLVKGGEFAVIRKRESYRDLIKGESIPSFLEV